MTPGLFEVIEAMQDTMSKKQLFRDGIILICVYFLVHGFMLLLTGTFHDDWLSYFHDSVTKNMEGMESGRPYYSFIIEAIWYLPGYGYRILSFFTYLVTYVFMYLTLREVLSIKTSDALCITVLALAMPINDARVLMANYPYALGMMCFFIASFILAKSIYELSSIRIRIIIEILYFLSFTLNSNLVLYGGVLLYLAMNTKPSKYYKFLDFVLLPIVFFSINKILFPVYGAYENYNTVNLERIKWTLISLPQICGNIFASVMKLFSTDNLALWIALTAFIIVFLIKGRLVLLGRKTVTLGNEWSSVLLFFFGWVIFIAGWFPYIVVRQNVSLSLTGIQGRDSMQIGIGLALIIYSITTKIFRESLVVCIAVLGFFHFNTWYFNYQTEWYRQLAFQDQIKNVEDIYQGGNYIVNCSQPSPISDRRFYTWSGNTAAATGYRNAFMFNGEKDAVLLENQEAMTSVLSHYPMFSDYNYSTEINGILDFEVDISNADAVRIKKMELFDRNGFAKRINEIGKITYTSNHAG